MEKKKKLPVYVMPEDRDRSIYDDTPSIFPIEKNHGAREESLWDDIRTFDYKGKNAVRKNEKYIQKSAMKHNLDPDLIRAVMYAENSRGHYIIANELADKFKVSNSILPMNINAKKWSKLSNADPGDMYNPEANIDTSALLLRRIRDRIDNPTPEKIGSIWNYSGKEKTNEFGEYVGKVYHEKPWAKFD